ncbi:MAG: type II toxin-antitoxin system RelB/DinJ family antitoxin [archaeon]|nr:type II toxin-antitoxin system RelB/DinJ family antitoxin [archaeon]
MVKTELIHVRIDPEIKEQSEKILGKLGVNMSYAVSMFLNQVILKNGFPFPIELPENSSEVEKLAKAIESIGGNGEILEKNQRILHLFSTNQIDYETAVFAIKRNMLP